MNRDFTHKQKMLRKQQRRTIWHKELNEPKRVARRLRAGGSLAIYKHKHEREIARRTARGY